MSRVGRRAWTGIAVRSPLFVVLLACGGCSSSSAGAPPLDDDAGDAADGSTLAETAVPDTLVAAADADDAADADALNAPDATDAASDARDGAEADATTTDGLADAESGAIDAAAADADGGPACVASDCTTPPADVCSNATELTSYDKAGTCVAGACAYAPHRTACPGGCASAICKDACLGVTCSTPPKATCADTSTQRTFASAGTCGGAGLCTYAWTDTPCSAPPAADCPTTTSARTYAAKGTCAAGACTYAATVTSCGSGGICQAGACACGAGLTGCPSGAAPKTCSDLASDKNNCGVCGNACTAVPSPTCANVDTLRVYRATCGGSVCRYNLYDEVPCPPGQGCSKGVCADRAITSCEYASGQGIVGCGAAADSCCTSLLVTGNTSASFMRSYDGKSGTTCGLADCNDPQYKAQVSNFCLDKYEITVGRFRRFTAAWNGGWRPGDGAGKHAHLNGGFGLIGESGWWSGYDSQIPTTAAAWGDTSHLQSDAAFASWAAGDDFRPINNVTRVEAQAFCIWDGGFLPSESEWNYAASGGSAQREFPWGDWAIDSAHIIAFCNYNATGDGVCTGFLNLAPVGTATSGAGRFQQLDLAGNVSEWTLDRYIYHYGWWTIPCIDCTSEFEGGAQDTVVRGGAFDWPYKWGRAGSRYLSPGNSRNHSVGARCARSPKTDGTCPVPR